MPDHKGLAWLCKETPFWKNLRVFEGFTFWSVSRFIKILRSTLSSGGGFSQPNSRNTSSASISSFLPYVTEGIVNTALLLKPHFYARKVLSDLTVVCLHGVRIPSCCVSSGSSSTSTSSMDRDVLKKESLIQGGKGPIYLSSLTA